MCNILNAKRLILVVLILGYNEEGIFRLSGSVSEIKEIKEAFNRGCIDFA